MNKKPSSSNDKTLIARTLLVGAPIAIAKGAVNFSSATLVRQAMGRLYTVMHQNVLDVFNEHGVQIMTPAYEGDPEKPKVVPKEQWYQAPSMLTQTPANDQQKS